MAAKAVVSDHEAILSVAEFLLDGGRIEEGEALIRRCPSVSARVMACKARIALSRGDLEAATDSLDHALRLDRFDLANLALSAVLCRRRGWYEQALDALVDILVLTSSCRLRQDEHRQVQQRIDDLAESLGYSEARKMAKLEARASGLRVAMDELIERMGAEGVGEVLGPSSTVERSVDGAAPRQPLHVEAVPEEALPDTVVVSPEITFENEGLCLSYGEGASPAPVFEEHAEPLESEVEYAVEQRRRDDVDTRLLSRPPKVFQPDYVSLLETLERLPSARRFRFSAGEQLFKHHKRCHDLRCLLDGDLTYNGLESFYFAAPILFGEGTLVGQERWEASGVLASPVEVLQVASTEVAALFEQSVDSIPHLATLVANLERKIEALLPSALTMLHTLVLDEELFDPVLEQALEPYRGPVGSPLTGAALYRVESQDSVFYRFGEFTYALPVGALIQELVSGEAFPAAACTLARGAECRCLSWSSFDVADGEVTGRVLRVLLRHRWILLHALCEILF
ncbi:MAG: hypothetical protein A2284_04690 [Deltaproteobacteria bacterium RIFOXYA12_FULL_61_11]|nr:MAG: hypothetical protein A2284_04690 [Deltaproteobacteria bacterium RIFOXYA12_FULL_61_11]